MGQSYLVSNTLIVFSFKSFILNRFDSNSLHHLTKLALRVGE